MSMLEPLEFRKATPEDYAQTIRDRPTRYWEWASDNVTEGWWNSIPGLFAAEQSLPPTAAEQLGPLGELGTEVRQFRERVEGGQNVFENRDDAVRAELDKRGIAYLSEDQYRESPYWRENLPYEAFTTEARAKARAEVYDRNAWRRWRMERYDAGILGYVTAFGSQMVGAAPDPTNLVAFGALRSAWALRSVNRLARIGRAAAVGAAEGGAATAVQLPAVAAGRQRFGDEMSYGEAVMDLAVGAALGGVFAGAGRALGDVFSPPKVPDFSGVQAFEPPEMSLPDFSGVREGPDFSGVSVHRALDELDRIQEAGRDIAVGRPIDLPAAQVAREKGALASGYDRVLRDPIGNPEEIIARVSPGEINDVIVNRGPAVLREDGEIVVKGADIKQLVGSRRGYGLAKIIWQHGERSTKDSRFQVARNDIVALPEVVRDYAPLPADPRSTRLEWRVDRDGRTVTYATSQFWGRPENRVVSVHVQEGDDGRGLSQRRPGGPGSPREGSELPGGYRPEGLVSPGRGPGSPAPQNVGAARVAVNPALGGPVRDGTVELKVELAEPEPKADAVDPDVQAFEALRDQGRFSAAELAAYDEIAEGAARLGRIERAYEQASNCVLGII